MKLNIGCGNYPIEGWVNLDKKGTPHGWEFGPHKDKIKEFDLLHFPYDIRDNSVEAIVVSHVLNQVTDHDKIFKEFYRILKPKGVLRIVDDNNESKESKYYKPHEHTVTKIIPSNIIVQLKEAGFMVVPFMEPNASFCSDKKICVNNHKHLRPNVDEIFIEALKWEK